MFTCWFPNTNPVGATSIVVVSAIVTVPPVGVVTAVVTGAGADGPALVGSVVTVPPAGGLPDAALGVELPNCGVTAFDAADGTLVPALFVAVTVNMYAVPFKIEGPETTALVALPPTTAVAPPGLAVTVYELIAAPPSDTGAVQPTDATPSPAAATTLVGGSGGKITSTGTLRLVLVPSPS